MKLILHQDVICLIADRGLVSCYGNRLKIVCKCHFRAILCLKGLASTVPGKVIFLILDKKGCSFYGKGRCHILVLCDFLCHFIIHAVAAICSCNNSSCLRHQNAGFYLCHCVQVGIIKCIVSISVVIKDTVFIVLGRSKSKVICAVYPSSCRYAFLTCLRMHDPVAACCLLHIISGSPRLGSIQTFCDHKELVRFTYLNINRLSASAIPFQQIIICMLF